MLGYVIFWTAFGVVAFAFALAIQMRVIIGVIVARALRARDKNLSIKASRLAMVQVGNGESGNAEAEYVHATYPAQVRQLRLARRVSVICPVLIVIIFALGRYFGKI